MKNLFITLSLTLIMAVSGFAGEKVLGLNAGISNSAFEDQTEAASTLSFGASFGNKFAGLFEGGVEFNMLASPYELVNKTDHYKETLSITQTMVGVYAKVNIPLVIVNPYIKGGLGYYMGSMEYKLEEWGDTDKTEKDFKGALGYNVGAGVETFLGIYGEVMFHIVERELDVEDAVSAAFNNVAVNVGYRFEF